MEMVAFAGSQEIRSINFYNNETIANWYCRSLRQMGFKGDIQTCKSGLTFNSRIRKWKDIISLAKILKVDKYDFIMNRKWEPIKKAII